MSYSGYLSIKQKWVYSRVYLQEQLDNLTIYIVDELEPKKSLFSNYFTKVLHNKHIKT